MSEPTREQRLNASFVKLADTLVDDYDVVELLHELIETCTELLDVDAGGLMLADGDGRLQTVVSTDDRITAVEVAQVDAGRGPCIDAFTGGVTIEVTDVADVADRWPEFAAAATASGYRSVDAIPLRLRGRTIGAMTLLRTRTGVMVDDDMATARALADVATIGIVQERLVRESHLVTEQLHYALESRVIIEQAKGVLAQATSTRPDEAFVALRDFSRRNRRAVREVAEALVARTISSGEVMAKPSAKGKR